MTTRNHFAFIALVGIGSVFSILSCQMDDSKQWNNPADVNGTNYSQPAMRVYSDTIFADTALVKLRLVATSANTSIAKVEWSVDRQPPVSIGFDVSDSVLMLHLPNLSEARHVVMLRVQDRTGLWSDPDTVRFKVWNEPPELSKVIDTILPTRRILSLSLSGLDSDGQVVRYLFDTSGGRWDSSCSSPTLKLSSFSDTLRTIVWGARDDLGKVTLDTFTVQFATKLILTQVRDTALSASKSLEVSLRARDAEPSGKIEKYLWSTSGTGWTDSSSDAATISLSRSGGGVVSVRWAVRNALGILSVLDTFNVSFVPAPSIDAYQVDSVLHDWTGSTGTVVASWSGVVPGFASESVTWTLRLGRQGEDLAHVYMGTGTSWNEKGVKAGRLRYVLVGKNRFGDSVEVMGSHIQTAPPMGMKFIPAGTFTMGSPITEIGRDYDEIQHLVTLSAFFMDSTPVTQSQYVALMGGAPDWSDNCDICPKEGVTWFDAALYCNARSKMAGLDTVYTYTRINNASPETLLEDLAIDFTKKGYRLPTEAEWEYAARGGTTTAYYWGDESDSIIVGKYALPIRWGWEPGPVATKRPNAYGLYDMIGNVLQWTNDWYGVYPATPQTNPTGPDSSLYRVARGSRSAYREVLHGNEAYWVVGIRCVLPIP